MFASVSVRKDRKKGDDSVCQSKGACVLGGICCVYVCLWASVRVCEA